MNENQLLQTITLTCPLCDEEHEIEERKRIANVTIKGELVTYEEIYYLCRNHKDEREFVFGKTNDINLKNARDAYKKIQYKHSKKGVSTMKNIIMYINGVCDDTPGIGGYGTMINYTAPESGKTHVREYKCGYKYTTKRRMELMALIVGLEQLTEPCYITIYSDSKYIINALTKGWLTNWINHDWNRGKNKLVSNIDLWTRVDDLIKTHKIIYILTSRYNNTAENKRCAILANQTLENNELKDDMTISLN